MLFLLQLDFRRHRRHGHIGDALAGLARDGGNYQTRYCKCVCVCVYYLCVDLNNDLDNLGDLTWDKV